MIACLLYPAPQESPLSGPQHSPTEHPGAVVVEYVPGQTLAQAVYLSGRVTPPALCSGIASCGRCGMRLIPAPAPLPEDAAFFTPEALAQGRRLGCRHLPYPGLVVELPDDIELLPDVLGTPVAGVRATPAAPPDEPGQGASLALDLGTTSLQWSCTEADGNPGSSGGMITPQMGAGSDIISRLAVASTPQGAERLQRLTLNALARLAASDQTHTPSRPGVSAMCLAANPAMTCITLGLPTRTLATAPYSLPCRGGEWMRVPGLPPLWVPPQLSPFVGGDISAGYAALAFHSLLATSPQEDPPCGENGEHASHTTPFPFLLADLGTNGEFLLAVSPAEAVTASVALGPALEGIGLRFGTEARPGAITGFSLSPGGLVMHFYNEHRNDAPPPSRPAGITGTGYLSLIKQLLAIGAVSPEGHFTPARNPLVARLFAASANGCLPLPGGMFLSPGDIEEILKVKAAFSAGLRCLLPAAGVTSHGLRAVYLAGALGSHVDVEALEQLGFFPPGLATRIVPRGNTALSGAGLLLRSAPLRDALVLWSQNVRALDLAADNSFHQAFPDNMRFAWQG